MTTSRVSVQADEEMMDFSIGRESIKFRVDKDVFEAVPDIASELAMEYADKLEQLTRLGDENDERLDLKTQKDIVYSTLRLVLFPESADRFIKRLSDQKNPIGQKRFGDITQWLLEQYGLRPTETDSASLPGSVNPADGTN